MPGRKRRAKSEVNVTEDDMDVESLEGLGPTSAERLNEAGVVTLRELVNRGPVELRQITKADAAYVAFWIREAEDKLRRLGSMDGLFMSGEEMTQLAERTEYCSTGSKMLDGLLQGDLGPECRGIETDAITEFYGKFGCGKSQLCLKLVAMAQLPRERGGLGGHVIYVDGENIYQKCIERVHHMGETVGLLPADLDAGVTVVRPRSSDQLHSSLVGIEEIIRKRGARMVIFDGFMSGIRADYGVGGRESLPPRARMINSILGRLRRIMDTYHVAIVLTNQVSTDPGVKFGDPTKAYGGDIVAHSSTYRVYLRKPSEYRAKAIGMMMDSPRHGRYFCEFYLSRSGPSDTESKGKFDPETQGDPQPGPGAPEGPQSPA